RGRDSIPNRVASSFSSPFSSVVLVPKPYNSTRSSHNVRTKYGDTRDATSGGATRRPDPAPGLAQGHPVRAGRVERPVGVGRPGGGVLPNGARFELDQPALTHHWLALF